MAHLLILAEPGDDPEVIEGIRRDWLLYGELHITNANGLTRLDPAGIQYTPGADRLRALIDERGRLLEPHRNTGILVPEPFDL